MTDTNEKAVEPTNVGMVEHEDNDHDVSPIIRSILEGRLGGDALAQLQWVHESQKEYRAEQKLEAFARSMVSMKADPDFQPVISHDVNVAFGQTNYSYTSLPAMVAELTPFLTKYGFSISWRPEYDGGNKVGVTCRLFHVGGHVEDVFLPSSLTKKQGMSNAQEVTGTQTTLKRNTVLSLLGLASGEMEPPTERRHDDSEPAEPTKVQTAIHQMARDGITVGMAEEFLQRSSDHWTDADLHVLYVNRVAIAEGKTNG
jgi:hypothetical protein